MDKNLTIGVLVGLGALALMPAAGARTMAQPRQSLGFGSLGAGGTGLGGGGRLIQLGGGTVPGYGGRVVDPGGRITPGGVGNGTGFLTPAGTSPYRVNPQSGMAGGGVMGLLSALSLASSVPKAYNSVSSFFQGKSVADTATPAQVQELKGWQEWDPTMKPDPGVNSVTTAAQDATLEGLPDAVVDAPVVDAPILDAPILDAASTVADTVAADTALSTVAADTAVSTVAADAVVTDVAADTSLGVWSADGGWVAADTAATAAADTSLGAWAADGGWLAADAFAADAAGAVVADAALTDAAATVAAEAAGGASIFEWLFAFFL